MFTENVPDGKCWPVIVRLRITNMRLQSMLAVWVGKEECEAYMPLHTAWSEGWMQGPCK
jgi:hypothetical protein